MRGFRRGGLTEAAGAALLASTILMSGAVAGASPDTGSAGADDAIRGFSAPEFLQDEPYPAQPTRDDISAAAVVKNESVSAQQRKLTIASPALRREVTVDVLLPADNSVPRPVLYVLDGVDAPDDYSKWMINGAPEFFADKNVNVVLLNGGQSSMYTNWEREDPELGWGQWETYLAEELPDLIDAELGASGIRGIMGNSMGAQAALATATRNPGLYDSVAGFSGCYSASDPMGMLTTRSTVTARKGNPDNMWAPGGPAWREHDSVINAENLRGSALYLSVGNGAVGRHETNPSLSNIVSGGALEVGANHCTRTMESRLGELGIPVTVDYEPEGIHDWGYWTDQLPKMWPTISKGLGL